MLIGNGMLIHKVPMTLLGLHWNNFVRDERIPASTMSDGFGARAAIPDGYYHPQSLLMPRKAGRIAARFKATGVTIGSSGAGSMGKNTSGTTGITFGLTGTGGLVSSASGIAALILGASGNIFASRATSGTATVTLGGTGTLKATGKVQGTAPISFAANWTPYAVGWLGGSTASGGALTEASIIAAMNANPPKVNIAKVNDVAVTGTGAPGSEWGP
jgi:hypothetical protein